MGVLSFDSTDDRIKSTSLGSGLAARSNSNAATILFLIKAPPDDATFDAIGYLLSGTGNGTARFGVSITNDEDLVMDYGSSRNVVGTFATNVYMLLISKPAGSPVTCRLHWKAGSGGAWTHANFSGTETFATTATMLELGAWQAGDFYGPGHMGVFAAWAANFSDADAEACDNNWRTSDLYNHSAGIPVSLIELNTSTPTDIGSSPAASLAVTGTTLDAAQTLESWTFDGAGGTTLSPAGLSHSRAQGSPVVHPTVAPAGQAHSRALGAPSASPQILPVGQAHTRVQGAPTVTSAFTVGPAGQAHARTLGSPAVSPQLRPAGQAHARAQGDPSVSVGFFVSPASQSHTRAQGGPQVNPTVPPAGLIHTRALGSLTTGTPSARQLGNPVVTVAWIARPTGQEHARQVGSATAHGHLTVALEFVAHDRVLGAPQLSARTIPASLTRTRSLGTPSVNPRSVSPASQSHTRAQGGPAVTVVWIARLDGQARSRALGSPTAHGFMTAGPPSLDRTRTQGTPVLSGRALPASLAHTRQLGDTDVNSRTLEPVALSRV